MNLYDYLLCMELNKRNLLCKFCVNKIDESLVSSDDWNLDDLRGIISMDLADDFFDFLFERALRFNDEEDFVVSLNNAIPVVEAGDL